MTGAENPSGARAPAAVVVLTYNSLRTISACVESVLATMGPPDELILVDNGSRDGTDAYSAEIARARPGVRAIANGTNLGYSAGCNVGIRGTDRELVALLNPDAVVFPGWLEGFASRLGDPQVGMVGPLSDNIAGDQFAGRYVEEGHSVGDLDRICRERFPGESVETKLLIGMCVAARRETFEEVGLLDEDLFLGCDDLEFSWRLRTRGYRLLVAKDVFVRHEQGVSFASEPKPKTEALLAQSSARLRDKLRAHYGRLPSSEEIWGIDILPPE